MCAMTIKPNTKAPFQDWKDMQLRKAQAAWLGLLPKDNDDA